MTDEKKASLKVSNEVKMSSSPSCSPHTKKKIIEYLKKGIRIRTDPSKTNFDDEEQDEETLPVMMGYLTPKMKEQARIELNETEEIKQKCLKELRELVANEPGLVSRMDDNFLIQFLRARKYDVDKAFRLLKNYFKFRKDYAYIIDPSDTEAVFNLIRTSFLGILKRRDKNGCAVFVVKFGMWDPAVNCFEDLFRAITAGLLFAVEDPATQVTGYRIIIDTRGITWKQLKYATPQNGYLITRSTQFCFPGRCKGVHLLCSKTLFKLAWAVVYPFLTTKIKNRIFMHGEDPTPLKEYISPTVLPDEFGGLAGKFDMSDWDEVLVRAEKSIRYIMEFGYK